MSGRGTVAAWTLAAALGILASVCIPPSEARRAPKPTATTTTTTTPTTPVPGRLRLGVFPWGAAGATTKVAAPVPENADASMAAVQRLRGGRPFVVHLYGDYDGVSTRSADGLLSEASWWSANGLKVAAVLRYRPADASRAAGYTAWLRTQTRRLAALAGTVSIQVGNEPNNPSAGAGDGAYPGVIGAIAQGVPAVRSELVAVGRSDVLAGFNWAAGADPQVTEPMWSQLRQAGGSAFTQAVGFVAVNVYPGTWSPPAATTVPTAAQIDTSMSGTLEALRTRHMPAAGVGSAAIVVGETGYPTSTTRSAATQDQVLRAVVGAVDRLKATYGVSDLYWFALRDGNTASGEMENGYGLLRDDYAAKPAFTSLQRLVTEIGA